MSKKYLVTGAAGFIASQVSKQLLDQGERVVGVDNLNDYYDVRLKNWRLEQLKSHPHAENFSFSCLDIEDQAKLRDLFAAEDPFDKAKYTHVWTTGGSKNREIANNRNIHLVKLMIAVRH